MVFYTFLEEKSSKKFVGEILFFPFHERKKVDEKLIS
jgi:hypothetical protein